MSEYPLTEKLQELKKKYEALSAQLSEPDVMSDMKKYIQLNREYKELEPIVAAGDRYIKMVGDLEGAKEILAKEKDEDLREPGQGGGVLNRGAAARHGGGDQAPAHPQGSSG